jgi:hypothetical protein
MDDIIRPVKPAISEFIPFVGVSFTCVMYGDMRYFSIKYLALPLERMAVALGIWQSRACDTWIGRPSA